MMPGGPVADAVFANLVPRIEKLIANGRPPGLATLLVGEDDASARYVGMKHRKAAELGCHSVDVHLASDTTQGDVLDAIAALNVDSTVDAVLFQYPAPKHIDVFVGIEREERGLACRAAHHVPRQIGLVPLGDIVFELDLIDLALMIERSRNRRIDAVEFHKRKRGRWSAMSTCPAFRKSKLLLGQEHNDEGVQRQRFDQNQAEQQ